MSITFAPAVHDSRPLHLLLPAELTPWLERQSLEILTWLESSGFIEIGHMEPGQKLAAPKGLCLLPGPDGRVQGAVAVLPDGAAADRTRYHLAGLRRALPEGCWHLVTALTGARLEQELLGWLLEGYRYTAFKATPAPKAELVSPLGPQDSYRLDVLASAEALTRNLINAPASLVGPEDLAGAAQDLAHEFGAEVRVITGDELLSQNFPMIHAVGRASPRAPRLIELNWGSQGPALTLVGKGICFDTGGLNIKPGASMGLMKKDMGGAATVLGLAYAIMALELKLRLRVLIPAAENSISGNAFRPQDILTSRKGLTVEINNTDAEGRLVLADALALADEARPDLIVSMATLTGAARVALGPDIPPFYTTLDSDAAALSAAAGRVADPLWRMPFHAPYEAMIEPGIADLDNAPSGGMAGSITAALFLRRFVTSCPRYIHMDIYGWQPTAAPGRPKGGVGQGARALLDALPDLLGI